MNILYLKHILEQGDDAIVAASTFLGLKMVQLDCSEVDDITTAQLTLLFSKIPETWEFVELAEGVINVETFSDALATQFVDFINNRRLPRPNTASSQQNINTTKKAGVKDRGSGYYVSPSPVKDRQDAYPTVSLVAKDGKDSKDSKDRQDAYPTVPLHPIKVLDKVITEYRDYLITEFRAKDLKLKAALEQAIDQPLFLAQEPFYQAHRPFKSGEAWCLLPIDAKLAQVMEKRSRSEFAYLHQSEAIKHLLGENASPLVVTTGTGSGKTETFLLPVIQNAIEDATQFRRRPGLTAILVYPMNALANDQLLRIQNYLKESGWDGAITVAKYDRGTTQKERNALREEPPHILLTNYMMLEYLLVRPADREDIFANHRCRFLVLDEVHTYRGTLGSNIALLVRRLRTHLNNANHDWCITVPTEVYSKRYPEFIPVATSATIKSVAEGEYTPEEKIRLRNEAVQEFFHKISGASKSSIRVIGEELAEIATPKEAVYSPQPVITADLDVTDPEAVKAALNALSDTQHSALSTHHSRLLWDLNRWLIRSPLSISQLVGKVKEEVKERSHFSNKEIENEIRTALLVGAALPEGTPGALQLRAHRFIRGGWQFHRCINPTCGKLYPMGEERCECGCVTAPLYLCRNCGADYLRFVGEPTAAPLEPSAVPDETEWMLYDHNRFDDIDIEIGEADEDVDDVAPQVRRGTQKKPQQIKRKPILNGSFDISSLAFSSDANDYPWHVTLAPARTRCLCCGATAGSRNVITPVALGTSAAVKVLSEGLVESLATTNRSQPGYDGKERLLIFSDSRQDAAHQARFIVFASRYDRMRRRVVELLSNGALSLQRVVELLGEKGIKEQDNKYAPIDSSAWINDENMQRIRAWEEAPLLDEIAVTAGYRATLINLGLVQINYHRLDEYVKQQGTDIARSLGISRENLEYICRSLLNEMRRRGCVSRELLRYHPAHPSCPSYTKAAEWERRLKRPQGYALSSGLPVAYIDSANVPDGVQASNPWRKPSSGGRGPSLERIFKHLLLRFGGIVPNEENIVELLEWLLQGSFVIAADVYGFRDKTQLLQVNAEVLHLQLSTEQQRYRCEVCATPMLGGQNNYPCPYCHGNLIRWRQSEVMENRHVKRILSTDFIPLVAGEHTAQVPNDVRVELEDDFKATASQSKINLLACSPTLEMGIDVGGLDAVILRNIPPRPDNYAQRGGRAGRRTRIGLVLGYARNTPHDQYFYDKPGEMIAGEVPAPALALGNRDVIFRHLNAIAFGAASPGLASKMVEYITTVGDINTEKVEALIAGVQAQTDKAISIANMAWQGIVLEEAGLDENALRQHLNKLPERIWDVINRTALQVKQLRTALDTYSQDLQRERAATRAGQLVARILGLQTDKQGNNKEADDRSSGYPLRRFAEFGILPGYEFPTQPAALRLLGDEHEEDPVSVARRFGIGQFQPEAQVFARTKRWKVIGLDNASPWNPRSEGATWLYRICNTCKLRFEADKPACPRCGNNAPGKAHPGGEFAGFLARRDESPILDEEERYVTRNLVRTYPQWDGQVLGRWTLSNGWGLRWSQDEEVRWVNEGVAPKDKDREQGIPLLHNEAKGYMLCADCGKMLQNPDLIQPTSGRRKTRQTGEDPYGHAESCSQKGKAPQPLAIVTAGKAEILRLTIPVPTSIDEEDLQSWGLSLGYALKAGMQHLYMLDGSEIDFEYEVPWQVNSNGKKYNMVSLTFIDPSLGGSGYLRRIATELHQVAKRAIEHLDHPNCETACYRCLKSYQNQRYHELLNYPQIMSALEQLSHTSPMQQPLETGDIKDPLPWLEAYAAGVGSPLELKFLRLFEQYNFHPQKQLPIPQEAPISIADFAMPKERLAIYIDGAAFHTGGNRLRDKFIRDRLRGASPPWQVVVLYAADLARGQALVEELKNIIR